MRTTVLAIDDTPITLALFHQLLHDRFPDVKLLTAHDGPEGLALATQQQPDLILLDVKMPSMNGFDVCVRLRANPVTAHIPVLMISSELVTPEDRVRGLETGADAYLSRPFLTEELYAHVTQLLRAGRQVKWEHKRTKRMVRKLSDRTDKLRASEERFRLLFEHSPDAIFVEDESGHILDLNPEACRLHGMNREELLGRNVLELVPPDMWETVAALESRLRSGEPGSVESYSLHRDGHRIPVELRASTFLFEGRPSLLLHVRDITERKQASRTLWYAEALEGLISHLLTHSLSLTTREIGPGIRRSLQTLAEFLGVDRVYMSSLEHTEPVTLHQWCVPGLVTQLEPPSSLVPGDPTWMITQLRNGNPVHLPSMDRLPADARGMRDYFAARGVQSALFLPMVFGNRVVACLGLEAVRNPRDWPQELVPPLRTLAQGLVNVMERQKAEALLHDAESRYRTLVEQVPAIAFVVEIGAPPRPIYISPRCEWILGITAESLLREPDLWLRLLPAEDRARVLQQVRLQAEDGKPAHLEFRVRAPNGKLLWMDCRCQAVADVEERPRYLHGVLVDITDRKRTEQELLDSAGMFRRIFQQSPVMMHMVDETGALIDVNQRWLEETGYQRQEVIGRRADFLMTAESARRALEEVMPRFWREGRVRNVPYQYVRKDGSIMDVLLSCDVLVRPNGSKASLSVVTDVTHSHRDKRLLEGEREILEMVATGKPLQQTLDALTRKVEQLAPGSFASVLLLEAGGNRLRVGAAPSLPDLFARAITAASFAPLLLAGGTADAPGQSLITPDLAVDPRWDGYSAVALALGLKACWALPIRMSTGDPLGCFAVFFSAVGGPTDDQHRLIEAAARIAGIAVQRERTVEALRDSEQQLRHAQKMEALGRLSSGVAHDFNNLLTLVLGHARLLLDEAGAGSPAAADLEQIISAGERAARLTRQLLTFASKQVTRVVSVDLNAVVEDMAQILRRTLGDNIELVTRLGRNLGFVEADATQLEQVIMNLAVNARDAMPEGGSLVLQTFHLHVSAHYRPEHLRPKAGSYVVLTVRDTGCGMTREVQERVFEPFFTTKEEGKGTGLGLSTVYGIVQNLNGHIELTSEVGKGTEFRVYFPATEVALRSGTPAAEAPSCGGHETILVVEDKESVRRLSVRILTSLGYRVLEARDGLDALHLLEGTPEAVHVVLTDIAMPRMDGVTLARRLREQNPGVKVLYTSGFAQDTLADFDPSEPGIQFIQKPYSRNDLARKIRALLEK